MNSGVVSRTDIPDRPSSMERIAGGASATARRPRTDGRPRTSSATMPNNTGTLTFLSQATYDGWVREESEFSNKGYKVNKGGKTINVGDDAYNLK